MKEIINNKIYFKSDFKDINVIPNINLANYIFNCMESKNNEVMLTDEELNKVTSYEIINKSKKVARGLNLLGLNKNDIVGLLLPNMIEFSYCVLGTLLNGSIISPINSISTIDEIKNTLSTVSPKVIIINHINYNRIKDKLSTLFNQLIAVIVINDIYNNRINNLEPEIIINNYNNNNNNNNKQPIKIIDFIKLINNNGQYDKDKSNRIDSNNDLAFILFSSGTTGNFKGVCLTHQNIISNINQVIKSKYQLYKERQIIITSLPFYHTFSLNEILLSILCFGGGFIFLKRYNLDKLLQLIQDEKVTLALIVPPIGVDLAKSSLVGTKYDCSSLKLIYSGAAPFPKSIIGQLKMKIGTSRDKNGNIIQNLKLFQGYGLTESVGFVTVANPYKFNEGSSGVIISNIIIKIIDLESGNNLDSNQVGEICIKSPSVMKCYYNNPNATNLTIDNEGFLLTGDIGYIDNDGEIYIIDRKKELIKSNGYQVAPAELENILLTHSKIKDACVIGVSDEKRGEVPRAYIVLNQNEQVSENEIHEWINSRVSKYKYLRGGIYFIDIIPKSPSGKILRRLLKSKSKL